MTLRLIEVRTYRLKPGAMERFCSLLTEQTLPLLRASGMDVVAHGRSQHEHESYFLIRAYASQQALVQQQDAFYSSAAWRSGSREALIDCIDTYLNTLLWVSDAGVEDLRANNGSPSTAGGRTSL